MSDLDASLPDSVNFLVTSKWRENPSIAVALSQKSRELSSNENGFGGCLRGRSSRSLSGGAAEISRRERRSGARNLEGQVFPEYFVRA